MWGSWNTCSKCGSVGTRKRIGECRLSRYVETKVKDQEKDEWKESTLKLWGPSCHSYLLDTVPRVKKMLKDLPNYYREENCEVPCDALFYFEKGKEMKAVRDSVFLSHMKMKAAAQIPKVHDVLATHYEKEGKTVALMCPGGSIDIEVKWFKDDKPLNPQKMKKWSDTNIQLDAANLLHFKALREEDSGSYICVMNGVKVGFLKLIVIPKEPVINLRSYRIQLAIGLTISFVIYLICVFVRCSTEILKFQKIKKKKGKKKKRNWFFC
ncbi:Ig-like V-type domain-containing protein FAM187A [Tachypleus tridentatus]|uniref:Ig-like V-type domain-containing protein FAM187A n=1 Tax=Tachypleus tridentatus TaxID=6853 RepID=UPI003FD16F51